MKWLLNYNGKSTSWYVWRVFAAGWLISTGTALLVMYIVPGPKGPDYTRHGIVGLLILALVLAPILETLLMVIVLWFVRDLIRLIALVAQKVNFSPGVLLMKKVFATEKTTTPQNAAMMTSIQIKILASVICGLAAMFLHPGEDWGAHAGLMFFFMSLLFFTLSEKSIWKALKAMVAVHFLANSIPSIFYILSLIFHF